MRAGGFTLLELVVVVIIIGVLMSLAVPSLSNSRGRRLTEMSEQMVLLINQARQEAVLSSKVWKVIFDRDADSYSFGQRNGSEFEQVSDGPFASVRTVPSIDFYDLEINGQQSSAEGSVYLFPTGEQDTFRLVLRAGEQKRIILMGPVGPVESRIQ